MDINNNKKVKGTIWRPLWLCWLACFVYLFMEWLFFVTKASVLSYFTLLEKTESLFVGAFLLFAGFVPLISVCIGVNALRANRKPQGYFLFNYLLPACILAATILLLLENFSYTVLGFNMGSFPGSLRYLYTVVFVMLVVHGMYRLDRWTSIPGSQQFIKWAVLVSLLPALVFALSAYLDKEHDGVDGPSTQTRTLPNILILSSDGVNAANLSVYGYQRLTTPFLQSLLDEVLIFDNHFSNAANTTGSVTALLTGKLPMTTQVVYPPDTLTGVDAYQHLPGMLKKLGYHNGDISIRYYADSEDLNFQEAFDFVNGRDLRDHGLHTRIFNAIGLAYPSQSLFLKRLYDRLSQRLLHMSGLITMENPFTLVSEPGTVDSNIDTNRMQMAYEFMDNASSPFFLHVHLLATHGPRFSPLDPLYSRGREQSKDYMRDFYDDAIRDFDNHVRDIVAYLKAKNRYDDTLLIINTDHGSNFYAGVPLPLLVKLPHSTMVGRRNIPSQRIDIAPAILDLLKVPVPGWMEGKSLFRLTDADRQRVIFASATAQNEALDSGLFAVPSPSAPFYTLGSLSLISCQTRYAMNLDRQQVEKRRVPGFVEPCPDADLPTPRQASIIMSTLLQSRGYETAGLSPDYGEVDWLQEFSGELPQLSEGRLYLPAVGYEQKTYAVVLQEVEEQAGIYEVLQTGPADEMAAVLEFDPAADDILALDDVQTDDGHAIAVTLTPIAGNSLRFALESGQL
ncbi:MAG: sulfatase-like hydrolase/transferase [Pseudomonadales bacterium]|nr:sulfatase-like hydrolase/transferase [Pseudomonadales bacterium]